MRRLQTIEAFCERFWACVDKSGDCWVWTRGRNKAGPRGYGRMTLNGTNVLAHRIAWGFAHGMPPDDLFVLHHCDNPPCVRPDHLFIGTSQDNMIDAVIKGRLKTPRLHGAQHPAARFTIEEVRSIIKRRKSGELLKSIAKSFGVVPETISKIALGDRWADALKEDSK